MRWGGLCALLATGGLVAAAVGCGDDDSVSEAEIARERAEAAKIARQDERLKQLEEQIEEGTGKTGDVTVQEVTSPSGSSGTVGPISGDHDSWPAGLSAWTVILASESSRDAAEAKALEAEGAGLPQVGVLYSSNYASLTRGYYVAFTGVLSRTEASVRRVEAQGAGFTDAYVRQVVP